MMNTLAKFLIGADGGQRPGTISNPAENQAPTYQIDIAKAQRDQELAAAMQQQGYVPNSGIAGVLAQALSGLTAHQLNKRSDETLSTALQKKYEDDNKRAQAAHEQQLAEEDRKYQRDLEKTQKEADIRAKAEADNRGPMNVDGHLVDPRTGKSIYDAPAKPQAPMQPTAESRDWEAYQRMTPEQRAQYDQFKGRQPATPKETPLPPDAAGRIALTDNFLKDAPEMRKAIVRGDLTGPIDYQTAHMGYGVSGEIVRKIQSGVDALRRALTGAGMADSEAASYVARYELSRGDTADTLTSKYDQLTKELTTYNAYMKEGHKMPQQQPGAPWAPAQPAAGTPFKKPEIDLGGGFGISVIHP